MSATSDHPNPIHGLPLAAWVACALAIGLIAIGFHASVLRMSDAWFVREEYSHGILIPFISAYLVRQRLPRLHQIAFNGSWAGVMLVAFGLGLKFAGDIGTFFILQQYALLVVLYGLVLSFTGWRAFKVLAVPLLLLLFMIPLPEFLLQSFSAQLQLISSSIGVFVIRLFGISAFAEGNVIDLGVYQLQVAEACDGLRYLFPLMTLGFIMAYCFRAAMWKRILLFVSSIPVTIFMNSFRIGAIGIMVEHWGIEMAEGFIHDFQGWVVFMASTGLMLLEIMLLSRIGKDGRPWRESFAFEMPAAAPRGLPHVRRHVPVTLIVSVTVLAVALALMLLMPKRADAVPSREPLAVFPERIDAWQGRRDVLEQIYLDALKLDDYVVANYVRGDRELVNFYVAWYDAQRTGETTHSPRTCLPAGGWTMTDMREAELPMVRVDGKPIKVNRVVIELNGAKQIVYYWFQQRGRVLTNEYVVKWYLFWDAITRNRTDGALVRLVSPWREGETAEGVEERLQAFASNAVPQLERHIPD